MPAIEMFTELDEWFDKPVRKYSSGMLARLGFGVAMNVDAEILLVDEVLAVGDVGFQNRCLQKMKEQRDQGKTILFVSHSLDMVQYLCKRVVLLDRGGMIAMGEPEQIITTYENSQYYRESEYVDKSSGFSTAINTQRFQLLATEISDSLGGKNKSFEPEEGLLVDFKCETNLQLKDLIFTFALLNQRREACIWEYIEGEKIDAGYLKSPFHLRVHVPSIPLSGGLYLVGFMVRDRLSLEKLCHHKAAGRFTVEASARERGMLTVPLSWECLYDH